MRPLSDNVIIKPIKVETRTASGIYLGFQDGQSQLTRQLYPNRAIVQAVGKSCTSSLQPGDEVVFMRWGGQELGDDELVISEKDIIAKIEDV